MLFVLNNFIKNLLNAKSIEHFVLFSAIVDVKLEKPPEKFQTLLFIKQTLASAVILCWWFLKIYCLRCVIAYFANSFVFFNILYAIM